MRVLRQGVSFLEVTLVVLFIGILAAVGTPYFARAVQTSHARNASIQIADYVDYIRDVAINEGRKTSLVVDPTSDIFASPDVDFPDQTGTRISIAVKEAYDPTLELTAAFDASLKLEFDLEGSALANGVPLNNGSINIRSGNSTWSIQIDGGTGQTTIVTGAATGSSVSEETTGFDSIDSSEDAVATALGGQE